MNEITEAYQLSSTQYLEFLKEAPKVGRLFEKDGKDYLLLNGAIAELERDSECQILFARFLEDDKHSLGGIAEIVSASQRKIQ